MTETDVRRARKLLKWFAFSGLIAMIPPMALTMARRTAWLGIVVWFVVSAWMMSAVMLLGWCSDRLAHWPTNEGENMTGSESDR